MNTNIFTYSLLRYVHSAASGEALNVGILFIFPRQKRVIFHAPTRLSRLSHSYLNFSEWFVKAHLKGIKQKAQSVTANWDLFYDDLLAKPQIFVAREFLLEDATALQFGEFRTGILDIENCEELASSYYELYFSDYEEPLHRDNQRNEKYISQKLFKSIIYKNKNVEQYLKKDIIVTSNEISLKFDYEWQNHQKHLVKPMAFDLETEEGIQEKSARNFGYLTLLNAIAKAENYTFDLFVSRPSAKNLFPAYDKALRVLDSIPSPKRIIEEGDIEEYTEELVAQIVGE
ncbi:Protein of unknown function [Pseudarcicella hirudinis]|uniref:DUF3037 domain-containing protein n=1 Tax=Pseudarcicella hirudinis TaxID=1079859 RepID=A0A1I5QUS6_9BACT|nr:DUF3037 domain-containing protein [Pseudarcicella hirudinis]SFP50048.1 Protein of unknown function [Pseudarcicella hirudinis]